MSKLVKQKIGPAIEHYLASDRIQQKEPRTKYSYERTLGTLLKITGTQLNTSELRATHISGALNILRETRSEASLNTDRGVLRKFVEHLHVTNKLSRNQQPMAEIDNHSNDGHEQPLHELILTPEQTAACFAAASGYHPRDRAMLALGVYAACRESEILDLKWKDVKGVDGVMQFYREKQNTWHRLPKLPVLEQELDMWRNWLQAKHGEIQGHWYVIPGRLRSPGGPALGQKVNPSWPVDPTRKVGELSRVCHEIFTLAGCDMEGKAVHRLRHTAACFWLRHTKGNVRLVQKVLGHKSIRTTEGYVQLVDGMDDLMEAGQTFDPLGVGDLVTPLAPVQVTQTGEPSNVLTFRPRKAG